ncbi:MAG: copper chaperone PCu(A)C [Dehalococcoidia bacterium]|nr:copper chaperone PCu(A)C [Dehalococcoidia bacterium]
MPANGELTLKPGGYHVMLMDLKGELKEGDTVELELEFAKAGKVKLTLPVKPGPGMAGMGMGMNESMTPGAGMHGMATPAPTAMK